eukprot:2555448-Alexandrium_andersonii.AAC.1
MASDVDGLPLVVAKRARRDPRSAAHAESRAPGEWILRVQGSGRAPHCLACKEVVAPGALKVTRRSNLRTGGRWQHLACLEGGFRIDDAVECDAEEVPTIAQD